jgi:hypothetical protein
MANKEENKEHKKLRQNKHIFVEAGQRYPDCAGVRG